MTQDITPDSTNSKETILLLGDGFFARGFLHGINRKKFNITQIYKDHFINPHDLLYIFQRNKRYEGSLHLRDFLYKNPDIQIQEEIKKLEFSDQDNIVKINEKNYNYDHLVIGLGARKTLKNWSDDINNMVNKKKLNIGIIGMGPIGFELGSILSEHHKIDMFDMLPETKVLNYVSKNIKPQLLENIKNKSITTTYEKMYKSTDWTHDKVIFCVGTTPNILTSNFIINSNLQIPSTNIYIGGDCANSPHIKTGQMAYQQGIYVAKHLNVEYKPNGISLNLGNKKVLIEDHNIIPNGIYPDIVIKLYSLFFI